MATEITSYCAGWEEIGSILLISSLHLAALMDTVRFRKGNQFNRIPIKILQWTKFFEKNEVEGTFEASWNILIISCIDGLLGSRFTVNIIIVLLELV